MAKKTKQEQAKKPSKQTARKSAPAGKRGAQPEKAKRKKRKTSGFAETKEYPTRKHPAKYKRKRSGDDIVYITFTHSKEVEINGKTIKTIPLKSNINPSERGNKKSYAYPRVYKGKRSALGSETDKYNLIEEDKKLVEDLFDTLPQVEVRYTSNSKKKAQNKKHNQ